MPLLGDDGLLRACAPRRRSTALQTSLPPGAAHAFYFKQAGLRLAFATPHLQLGRQLPAGAPIALPFLSSPAAPGGQPCLNCVQGNPYNEAAMM